jgi:hypothetical protein
MDTESRAVGRTVDLSLFGCGAEVSNPQPAGARVSIRIVRGVASFAALGRVVNCRGGRELGMVFTKIEPESQSVLEKWLNEARKRG